MKPFRYVAASTIDHSLELIWSAAGAAAPLAGGTELLGLMKTGLASPGVLVDLKPIARLSAISVSASSARVGSLATLASIEDSAELARNFTALTEAATAVGTPQIRNRGTLGGNLCQRPRCLYLRSGFNCFKTGHRGCPALEGSAENLGILGQERSPCVAVHPSDPAVALTVFDTKLLLVSAAGRRTLPLSRFFEPPEVAPFAETALEPGELVLEIRLALPPPGSRSAYVKAKDRTAFAFALVSAAASVAMTRGKARHVRIALGGVSSAPWRALKAEALLEGRRLTPEVIRQAAEAELAQARPLRANGFKIPLAVNVMTQAVTRAAGLIESD